MLTRTSYIWKKVVLGGRRWRELRHQIRFIHILAPPKRHITLLIPLWCRAPRVIAARDINTSESYTAADAFVACAAGLPAYLAHAAILFLIIGASAKSLQCGTNFPGSIRFLVLSSWYHDTDNKFDWLVFLFFYEESCLIIGLCIVQADVPISNFILPFVYIMQIFTKILSSRHVKIFFFAIWCLICFPYLIYFSFFSQ